MVRDEETGLSEPNASLRWTRSTCMCLENVTALSITGKRLNSVYLWSKIEHTFCELTMGVDEDDKTS